MKKLYEVRIIFNSKSERKIFVLWEDTKEASDKAMEFIDEKYIASNPFVKHIETIASEWEYWQPYQLII